VEVAEISHLPSPTDSGNRFSCLSLSLLFGPFQLVPRSFRLRARATALLICQLLFFLSCYLLCLPAVELVGNKYFALTERLSGKAKGRAERKRRLGTVPHRGNKSVLPQQLPEQTAGSNRERPRRSS